MYRVKYVRREWCTDGTCSFLFSESSVLATNSDVLARFNRCFVFFLIHTCIDSAIKDSCTYLLATAPTKTNNLRTVEAIKVKVDLLVFINTDQAYGRSRLIDQRRETTSWP